MSILDARSFPSGDPDAQELLRLLLEVFGLAPPVQRLVQGAGMQLAWFSWGSMADVWPTVLERAATEKALRKLVKLVVADTDFTAYVATYGDFLDRILAPSGSTVSAGEPYFVNLLDSRKRSFIDRDDLRGFVKELEKGHSKLLVVDGPEDSGKSYTWRLIEHVADQRKSFTPHRVDLSGWAGAPAGPFDVMVEVANELVWGRPEVDPTAQEDTQARVLLSWFRGKIKQETKSIWLVFDGLDGSTVTEAALRMIKSIASAVENRTAGELRVVFIDLRQPLPDDVEFVLRDSISYIGEKQLRQFFGDVAKANGQTLDDAGLDVMLAELLGPGPYSTPLPLPMPTIGAEAARLARETFMVGGGGG